MRAMQKAQIMWSIFANTPASEPRPFLQILLLLTFLTVPSSFCNLCANMSSNRGSRLICFHRRLLWQILRGTNALCFQLLTLIAAYWLRIGPIVPPLSASFSIFIISFFDHFAENVSRKCHFKKGYKLLDYDRSPLFDLIKSFLHSRSLIAYGLVVGCSKNHFYLENCPAFNGSPVTCLRTCLSKIEFPVHIFLLLAVFGNRLSALQVTLGEFAWFPAFLVCSIGFMCGLWIRRAGHVWYWWYARALSSSALQPAMAHFQPHLR